MLRILQQKLEFLCKTSKLEIYTYLTKKRHMMREESIWHKIIYYFTWYFAIEIKGGTPGNLDYLEFYIEMI